MADFERKHETALNALPNEGILAYIESARAARDLEGARKAAAVLAFRYWKRVLGRVRVSTPPRDVDDVAMNVMESAVRSAFDGRFMGEFANWINTITARRIADYHAKAERTPKSGPLPDEHQGDDVVWVEIARKDEELVLLEYREIAERIRCSRPQEIHRHVIQLYGPVELNYNGLDAAQTRAEIERLHPGETLTETNIHQIFRRFKKDFAAALLASDEPDGAEEAAGGGL